MDLQDKLFEIDLEIRKGLKLRAADRLKNLLGHYPVKSKFGLSLPNSIMMPAFMMQRVNTGY